MGKGLRAVRGGIRLNRRSGPADRYWVVPGDAHPHPWREVRDLVWRPEVGRWTLLLTLFVGVNVWAVAFADGVSFNNAQDSGFPWHVVAQAVTGVAAGALIKRWRALWLALLPWLIAGPFGYPNDSDLYEPPPLWFDYLFFVPFLLVLIGIGVVLGRALRTRSRARLATWCLLGVGIVGCIPLAYAAEIEDPVQPSAGAAGFQQLVSDVRRPGGVCPYLSQQIRFQSYRRLGAGAEVRCQQDPPPGTNVKSAVTVIERRNRAATLKLQGRKAKPVYLAAARPTDIWRIEGIAASVDELPEIQVLTTSGLNEQQLVEVLLRIEPRLEGANCHLILVEPGRFN